MPDKKLWQQVLSIMTQRVIFVVVWWKYCRAIVIHFTIDNNTVIVNLTLKSLHKEMNMIRDYTKKKS